MTTTAWSDDTIVVVTSFASGGHGTATRGQVTPIRRQIVATRGQIVTTRGPTTTVAWSARINGRTDADTHWSVDANACAGDSSAWSGETNAKSDDADCEMRWLQCEVRRPHRRGETTPMWRQITAARGQTTSTRGQRAAVRRQPATSRRQETSIRTQRLSMRTQTIHVRSESEVTAKPNASNISGRKPVQGSDENLSWSCDQSRRRRDPNAPADRRNVRPKRSHAHPAHIEAWRANS